MPQNAIRIAFLGPQGILDSANLDQVAPGALPFSASMLEGVGRPIWECFGAPLGATFGAHLGRLWGQLGAILGPCGAHLGPHWAHLGGQLLSFRAFVDHSEKMLVLMMMMMMVMMILVMMVMVMRVV